MSPTTSVHVRVRAPSASPIAHAVASGLERAAKSLPAWLFYDDEGSRLYEQITRLPEYYPWRAEREIFVSYGDALVAGARAEWNGPRHVVELGAGTAEKSSLLVAAVARQQRCTVFMPIDVSGAALAVATTRLAATLPDVDVRPFVGQHEDAFPAIRALGPRRLVMFIGSSIGNFEDDEAEQLLAGVRRSVVTGGALLLGTDLKKDPAVLVPAYDDAAGVTAAFNKNVLARINRELGGTFDLDTFRHVALWNEARSRIEMHLESRCDQRVDIAALGTTVSFARGERIHTESSVKYDLGRVDRLLRAGGWRREQTFYDEGRRFAVHLARAIAVST